MLARLSTRLLAIIAAVPLVAGLAACGSTGDSSGSTTASGPVQLDFWGWAPGYDKSVELFNASHPDIKVNFVKTPSGAKGGYEKMLNAVKAGTAPCLAQVGYESLPSFAVQDALQDVSQYANPDQGKFVDWTWNQVKIGDSVYGAPVDTAPLAFYYRTDVYQQFHLQVPTTWDQYAAEAQQLHSANPDYYLGYYDADVYLFAGLAWQRGAHWFGTNNNSWQVGLTGPQSTQVAQYWQGLLDKKLLKTEPSFDTAWYADVNTGHIASFVGPVWASALVEQNAPQGKGLWQVAPIPQWQAGQHVSGDDGGSATAVLKGCAHPQQAWEFASWMSTNADSFTNLIKQAGLYPAAKDMLNLPAVNSPYPYFGNQNIWTVFRDAAAQTNTNWQWGPTMNQVNTDFSDSANKVISGSGTLSDALNTVQGKTVDQMKQLGLSVSGS